MGGKDGDGLDVVIIGETGFEDGGAGQQARSLSLRNSVRATPVKSHARLSKCCKTVLPRWLATSGHDGGLPCVIVVVSCSALLRLSCVFAMVLWNK